MKRRNVLKIFAVTLLGFAVLASNAVAQQKSLKEQLVGAWTLVSFEVTNRGWRHAADIWSQSTGCLDPRCRWQICADVGTSRSS